jgi:hypothetical protein
MVFFCPGLHFTHLLAMVHYIFDGINNCNHLSYDHRLYDVINRIVLQVDAFAGRGDSHRACERNPRVMFDQLTTTLKNDKLSWLRSINLVKGFSTLQLVFQ